jgi:dipeptidyl aminopeptidase/acylaminoacyl peptidase
MSQFNCRSLNALCGVLLLAAAAARGEPSASAALYIDGVPADEAAAPAAGAYTVPHAAQWLDWSADGVPLIATRDGATEQLQRLDGPLGLPVALPAAAGAPLGLAAHPFIEGEYAWLRDSGSGAALLLQRSANGAVQVLADATLRPTLAVWAHDGSRLAYTAHAEGRAEVALFLTTAAADAAPQLLAELAPGNWQVLDWSADDQKLLLRRLGPDGTVQLWLGATAGGEVHPLKIAGQPADAAEQIGRARFAADGLSVLYLGDWGVEYSRLRSVRITDGAAHDLTPLLAHAIEDFDVSADAHRLAYSYNFDGQSRVVLVDQQHGSELIVPELPAGVVREMRFDHGGTKLAINVEAPNAALDVYEFDSPSGRTLRLTKTATGPVKADLQSLPQTVRVTALDHGGIARRALPTLLFRPAGAGPYPVLVMLGDLASEQRAGFDPFIQYCVRELHLAVVVPVLRDGASYARALRAPDDDADADGVLRDVGSVLVWIGLQPDLDRSRVALMGQGLGGSLALQTAAEYSDRLRAAITADAAIAPPSSGVLRRPVLMLRGLEVAPPSPSAAQLLLWRLRSRGTLVWYASVAGNEGADPTERAQLWQVAAQFLRTYLAE